MPRTKVREDRQQGKDDRPDKDLEKRGAQRRVGEQSHIVLETGRRGKAGRQLLPRFRREGALYVVVDLPRLLVDHGILGRVVDVQLLILRRLTQRRLADLIGGVWSHTKSQARQAPKRAEELVGGNLGEAFQFRRRFAGARHWLLAGHNREHVGRVIRVDHPQLVFAGRVSVGRPLIDRGVGRQEV
jgi:hypothetical protein